MKLNGGTRHYSSNEKMLFDLVPKNGARITSNELVRLRKAARRWPIANPRNSVISAMRSLMEKIDANKEAFRLRQSPQLGPYPSEYWIENRNRAKTDDAT